MLLATLESTHTQRQGSDICIPSGRQPVRLVTPSSSSAIDPDRTSSRQAASASGTSGLLTLQGPGRAPLAVDALRAWRAPLRSRAYRGQQNRARASLARPIVVIQVPPRWTTGLDSASLQKRPRPRWAVWSESDSACGRISQANQQNLLQHVPGSIACLAAP